MRRVLILIHLILITFVAGCAYKPDVQQGNTFEEAQVAQLKPGMTQQQVNFILGTALLKDPFHKDRWDYVYTYAKGYNKAERRLLTLYFKGDNLVKVDDSQVKKVTLKN
jgi:outer membrane protein assembly factor BamE